MNRNGIPKWLSEAYLKLKTQFGDLPFTVEEASKILGKSYDTTITILSELKKRELVKVSIDPENPKKKTYILKSLAEEISRGEFPSRDKLQSLMKKAADLIRTRVDYTYILLLLFYKMISDVWLEEFRNAYNELINLGCAPQEAEELAKAKDYHIFDIPEECLWHNVIKDREKLYEKMRIALNEISSKNDDLKEIFDYYDFTPFMRVPENNEILRQLIELFDGIDLSKLDYDVLGEAYEYILRNFAPTKAKEGEVYTPREVIDLLVNLLDPRPEMKILDPAAGSGGMLIGCFRYVERIFDREEAGKLFLYGQEVNHRTRALAKMNMLVHGIRNQKIELGDSLLNLKFDLESFDIVIANPPWNQDGYPEDVLKKNPKYDKIYKYGYPPSNTADWAWIQLMIASAKDDGKVGIVLDSGSLFRGGSEKRIRQGIVDDDLLECVILLPEKLFYNTGAPGIIMIFNKRKPLERREKILFINASQEYRKHPEVKRLNQLALEHIEKIIEVYKEFKEIPGFSRIVSLGEIREKEYNLNVSLYVFPEEEKEEIDLEKEYKEFLEIERQEKEIVGRATEYVKGILEAIRK